MSFLDRARQAAEQARQSASESIAAITTPEAKAEMQQAASQVGTQMRGAAGHAKRGIVTAIEKIDPGLLADIIIKATALQERANRSLRDKASAYRVAEITITATIPPQIGFSISRIGDIDEDLPEAELISSDELEAAVATADTEVISLDGEVQAALEGEPAG
jgi:hypothetical protein